MGIFGGIVDVAKSVGGGVLAPFKGAAKVVATGLETSAKVGFNVLTLQPGKAIDELGKGLHEQVDNVTGIPKDQWNAVKGAAGGLGETLSSGAKFIGEPIRGAARIGANGLETIGSATGNALMGNFSGAGSELIEGVSNNFSILGETANNQVNNLV